jgi:hypothetical protein
VNARCASGRNSLTYIGALRRTSGGRPGRWRSGYSPWPRRRESRRSNGSAIPAIFSFAGDLAGILGSRICGPVSPTFQRNDGGFLGSSGLLDDQSGRRGRTLHGRMEGTPLAACAAEHLEKRARAGKAGFPLQWKPASSGQDPASLLQGPGGPTRASGFGTR